MKIINLVFIIHWKPVYYYVSAPNHVLIPLTNSDSNMIIYPTCNLSIWSYFPQENTFIVS